MSAAWGWAWAPLTCSTWSGRCMADGLGGGGGGEIKVAGGGVATGDLTGGAAVWQAGVLADW
jgi:hypothetical protein